MEALTVLTPVYINVPERWHYFTRTIESFYSCCQFKGDIIHYVFDDRSPLHGEDIKKYCGEHNLKFLGRSDENERRGFFDVFQKLVSEAKTEHCLYLEPDHYFYLPYDFITPVIKLYRIIPDLYQVYLRAPLEYVKFRLAEDRLVTTDRSVLLRVRIDEENTGWIGQGRIHESFSFMPSVFRSSVLQRCLAGRFIPGGPAEVELTLAHEWQNRRLVGYLNAQAFCYHIGAAGKHGPGGYLQEGDRLYESVWSQKIL